MTLAVALAPLSGCVQCDAGSVREGNRCVRSCNSAYDCAGGEVCQDGACREGGPDNNTSSSSSVSLAATSQVPSSSAGSSSLPALSSSASSSSAQASSSALASSSLASSSLDSSSTVSSGTSAVATSAVDSSSAGAASSSQGSPSSSAATSSSSPGCTTTNCPAPAECIDASTCALTFNIQVAASDDDALQDPSTVMTLVPYPWASFFSDTHYVGLRFAVPAYGAADVLSAHLRLRVDSDLEDTPHLDIRIEASATPLPFTSDPTDISDRATAAGISVPWAADLGLPPDGNWVDTPDVSVLLRAVPTSGTLDPHLVFIFNGPQSLAEPFEFRFMDYPGGMYTPLLVVTLRQPFTG